MPSSEEKKPVRPPNDRGQGRKKLPAEERREVRSIRLNDKRWEAFKELGAGEWLEPEIDRAIKAKRKKENPPS